MKHYLHIWALLMLFIHLASLTGVSFLPGERDGVSIRKVCLRKENKAKLAVSTTHLTGIDDLFRQGADLPENKPEIKLCSVKLFCTTASDPLTFFTLLLQPLKPPFEPGVYHSLATPLEPDPPRVS